jgi:hypothetical protein
MLGMIVAAPLLSAAVHVAGEIGQARARDRADAEAAAQAPQPAT